MGWKSRSDVNKSASPMRPTAYHNLREHTHGVKAAMHGVMARTTDESVVEAEQAIVGALRSVDDDCCSTEGLVDVVKTLEETILVLFTRLRATEADLHDLRAERLAFSAPERPFSPIAPGDEHAALDRERTKTRALAQMIESLRARNAALERLARPADALPALRTRVHMLESELAQTRSAQLRAEAARVEGARADAAARVEDLEGRAAAAEAARNAMFVDLQCARDDAAGLRAENERLCARERRLQADVQRLRSFRHRAADDSDSDACSLKERHKNLYTSVWLKRSVPVWLPRESSSTSTSASGSGSESDSPPTPRASMATSPRPLRPTRRPQTAR